MLSLEARATVAGLDGTQNGTEGFVAARYVLYQLSCFPIPQVTSSLRAEPSLSSLGAGDRHHHPAVSLAQPLR